MTSHRERKSTRLKTYDYTQTGAYFVTICTHNREHLFGEIVLDQMQLNHYGRIVHTQWQGLPSHYPHISIDTFIVMPNHTHAIIIIHEQKQHGLSEIIRNLKTYSAKQINQLRDMANIAVWQRSFHDHIIRNEYSLNLIRQYIIYNPALWEKDTFYDVGAG